MRTEDQGDRAFDAALRSLGDHARIAHTRAELDAAYGSVLARMSNTHASEQAEPCARLLSPVDTAEQQHQLKQRSVRAHGRQSPTATPIRRRPRGFSRLRVLASSVRGPAEVAATVVVVAGTLIGPKLFPFEVSTMTDGTQAAKEVRRQPTTWPSLAPPRRDPSIKPADRTEPSSHGATALYRHEDRGRLSPPDHSVVLSEGRVVVSVDKTKCNDATIRFTQHVSMATPGRITYRWLRSDDATAPIESRDFAAAGTVTLSATWRLGSANGEVIAGWQQLQVLTPSTQAGRRLEFKHVCPSPPAR